MRESSYQLYAIDDPPPEEVSFELELRHDGEILETVRLSTRWSDEAIASWLFLMAHRHSIPIERRNEIVQLAIQMRDARKPR